MALIKLKLHCDDTEHEIEESFDEDWTWPELQEVLEGWLFEAFDIGFEILEIDGEPYKEE